MASGAFVQRHLGPREAEHQIMLATLGQDSLESLVRSTVPEAILTSERLNVPEAMSETAYLEHIGRVANENKLYRNHIGLGYHPTEVPSVIRRNVLENPGWYTAYTPYQAEIAQGRLEALMNFQTMVCELTGMEMANASLLDEATAAAEAMTMLYNARSRSVHCSRRGIPADLVGAAQPRQAPRHPDRTLSRKRDGFWGRHFWGVGPIP
jgi:glycine dehydrogenase